MFIFARAISYIYLSCSIEKNFLLYKCLNSIPCPVAQVKLFSGLKRLKNAERPVLQDTVGIHRSPPANFEAFN